MKKLSLFTMLIFLSLSFALPQSAMASLSPVQAETSLSPTSKGLTKKEKRQRVRQLRKKYRKEMRGMNKMERRAFLDQKMESYSIDQQMDVPRQQLLIIGLIVLLVSVLLDILLRASIGGFFWTVGVIILIVWLVLFLLDYA